MTNNVNNNFRIDKFLKNNESVLCIKNGCQLICHFLIKNSCLVNVVFDYDNNECSGDYSFYSTTIPKQIQPNTKEEWIAILSNI